MKFAVRQIDLFERDVRLRMPFRFGIVTLTGAPQAFARVRIRLENGAEAEGAAAEMLVPKWFDKNPALSNEDNLDQLRASLALAKGAYLGGGANTAFGHFQAHYRDQIERAASKELNALVACYGPALIDRALVDALCRGLGVSFYDAVRRNIVGLELPAAFLESLKPASQIAARHTVGLLDPIGATEQRIDDGLPETLEEVVARYGHRWFKLKVGGDVRADVERLSAIASVLDRLGEYHVTLDGNEQYESVDGALALWQRMKAEPRLRRLVASVVFIEQPIKRHNALSADISALGKEKPVIIDESDDSLDAFARAKSLGYRGVSSKTCKGLYKSIINAARCAEWGKGCFMSAEDLTVQAGVAVQQDLALVSLLGIAHVERNGHHYVNGMAGLPAPEQDAFLRAHPDLYERSHGAVRLKIGRGQLALGSLHCAGFASGALPEWSQMGEMKLK
jgi:L-alanine-DL-glutamate epimerase-like enolase superfamily enzyme